ncbi:MAG TPA: hypothetical protein GXZ87_07735 [Bacteroidales bacterium]|nr:hypothetical protein [Bacteroidales bacterium]
MELLDYYKDASSVNLLTPIMYLYMGLYYYEQKDYVTAYYYAYNIDFQKMPKHQELVIIFKLNCIFHLIKNNSRKEYRKSRYLLFDSWIISDYIEFLNIPSKHIYHYYSLIDKIQEDLEKNKVLTYTDYELYDVRELLIAE